MEGCKIGGSQNLALLANANVPMPSYGKVFIAGAEITNGILASAELYDPAKGTFNPTGSMGNYRYNHTATLLPNGKVLIVGGDGTPVGSSCCSTLDSTELYDPATGTFNNTSYRTLIGRSQHTARLLPEGRVLIAGGVASRIEDPLVAHAEVYPLFFARVFMTYDRYNHTATLLANGEVLIVGGSCCELADSTAERYH